MEIPILTGVYADENSEFRESYPLNMIPVAAPTGISSGFLKPADGITSFGPGGVGPGVDRGSFPYFGICYRVMGDDLIIYHSEILVTVGTIGGGATGPVRFASSTQYIGIVSDNEFWLSQGLSVTQNTDPNIGNPIDVVYIDGYFVLADSGSIYVTELGDPFTINPLKYSGSDVDPDLIVGLLKIRNELYVINETTIEVFQNVGGELFPFQRVEGARIDKGAVGTGAFTYFIGTVVFVGNGKSEAPGIWMGLNADTTKISTREIDIILQEYSYETLREVILEVRVERNHQQLLVQLPDKTLAYDHIASKLLGRSVWSILSSAISGEGYYKAKFMCWAQGRWIVSDGNDQLGYYDVSTMDHYGETVGWEFKTNFGYNESNGAIFHELELVGLPGRVALGENPTIWTSYSLDGETWSQEKPIFAGKQGNRTKRLIWLSQGLMENYRVQMFRGNSDAHLAVARLEARIERLLY